MYTIIISFYVTRTWRTFVLTTTCTIANIIDHDVRPESDDIGMEALNSWKWCKMQYLSFWHLARIQLEESDPARRKFNRNLVKRSKEVDCYQYSGITSNFYGNELSILEHSCYTSDTTDRRQATGINGENRTSRFVQFQVRAFFENNCKYDLFR